MPVKSLDAADNGARKAILLLNGAEARGVFPRDAVRLDDETRADVGDLIVAFVGDIVRALCDRMAVHQIDAEAVSVRLARAGMLRDTDLVGEVIDRARLSRIASRLPLIARESEASFLVRLSDCPDDRVASAATALLRAENRRRAGSGGTELPAELHHRMVWWVAAAVQDMIAQPATDRMIVDAALAILGTHDEGERVEACASRLAAAIDARPAELGEVLLAALGDTRLALFIAVLARATGTSFDNVRQAVLDPEGDRLWLLLRAQDVARPFMAEIGVALTAADRRRDVHAIADWIDWAFAIDVEAAQAAISDLSIPRDFRAARRALEDAT
ncbi:conserved hypothetical protein [Sphingomonas sp. EC-HK361]|uniref:DUF2336 domain-containing protein n=1 Tax=Sphingomonas sp. EC-HK361 TaxID=2038397 RepID=UPI00125AE4C6|nr:DUF2336 domain-containing protein [Sphingomonas sp. EC-HK361]VVT07071.1 conserved hypothetical protein [Sphingomonas sp. EC-HK361]